MEYSELFILVIFGVFGGFLSGLIGVGGGIIFIPIIAYFLREAGLEGEEFVRYLLANSFATIFFTGIISTWKQYRIQSFYPRQILATASTAMISGTLVSYLIASRDWYSQKAFQTLFLGMLAFTFVRFIRKNKKETIPVEKSGTKKYILTGILTGVVTSLSGLGGGIVMIPLFNQYIRINMKAAAAISIGVIPMILIPVLLTYLFQTPEIIYGTGQWGYVLPVLFLPMVAGLLFAAPLGVASAQKMSDKLLQIIFASLVIIVIINTIVNLV